VLIGQSDKKAGGLLAAFYKKVCDNDPPIARMNIINAELTKLSVNSFMTMKISFANLISNLCEKLPGGNVDVVTETLALFGGIGKKSLRGGLGYGGPCLPRDNVALSYLIKNLGYEISLPSAVDQFNRSLVSKLFDIVLKHSQKGSSILVLGLSYKPHTWVIEESQGIALSKFLADSGYELNVYDPKAMEVAKQVLPPTINFANSLEEAVQNSDIVVITTPDQDFKRLSSLISAQKKQFVVIDAWRCLPELSQNSSVKYIPLGIGLDNNLKDKLLQLSM
jgi:UDPglucose 6-dehydrogenase